MRLREYQKKSGLTIKESARILGLPMSTYNGYLVGNRQPDIDTLCKLADFFHCSLDELVGRETHLVNLEAIKPTKAKLIEQILVMNELQELQAVAFIAGLMGL